ncbi:restriction endonuclease subunit S [Microcystis aeruginosa]|jgi:type I restriction enzyme S subunit|uniref:restriction endonuclease subunit S n=1 Tax=Microcystis aeruginosa TaxID=1126 RepID=UPI00118F3146|nr:restriction endonuclease subunit S [Microcystis aeruginosa]NCQ93823.1 restriction endonuclease subunit S [Microcystis aeruginosa W11-03]NCS50369.1 restriction endonuclease subunit S [Microcystis aeruginosa BK11-02]TRU94372.1 MAG: restriction endonuclease subunit S [Microcystis wesenbergii Mw_QC_B_20070930_S4D]TRV16204.1 MAG: restriction endonuclease subunit S [Microcystis wesenbergii Mw_QC_B_20070930_S4]TYT72169.1 restriction endonuclease subunit S [Microcystis aeruginosa KLA2]
MRTTTFRDVLLEEIAEIKSGVGFPISMQGCESGDFPFAKVGDISNRARSGEQFISDAPNWVKNEDLSTLKFTPFPTGTIVFAKIGEAIRQNFRAVSTRPMLFDNNVMGVIPQEERVDTTYLYFYLRTLDFYHLAGKTTVPAIRKSTIEKLKIPLPPLEEQRRIAAILDKADGVRRKRKEAIRLTEELLKSTFLEMFGDPVTNPKGWEICSMKKIVVETQYGTAEKSQEVMGGLPILRMNNITYSGEIDLNSLKWCQIPPKDEDKFTVKRGDLLFNRTNSPELVGKTAVWRSDGKFAYAGYLIRVRFDKSKANSEYVSAFLNSNYGKRYLLEKAKPSINMSNFSASEFLKIPILLPDIETQHRFDEFVSYTRMMSQHLSDGLGDYNNLFNSLLQRAFRGEL